MTGVWLPCIACGSVIKRERGNGRVTVGHVGPPVPACHWVGEALATGELVLPPLTQPQLAERLARRD